MHSQPFILRQLCNGSVNPLMFVIGWDNALVDRLLDYGTFPLSNRDCSSLKIRHLISSNLHDPTRETVRLTQLPQVR